VQYINIVKVPSSKGWICFDNDIGESMYNVLEQIVLLSVYAFFLIFKN